MSSGDTPYPLFVSGGPVAVVFLFHCGDQRQQQCRWLGTIDYKDLLSPVSCAVRQRRGSCGRFSVAITLLFVMMPAYGFAPSWNLFLAPVIFAVIVLTATGLGTMLAALNVTYRDFRYVVPFMIQMGLFATPTIYMQPTGHESETFRWLLHCQSDDQLDCRLPRLPVGRRDSLVRAEYRGGSGSSGVRFWLFILPQSRRSLRGYYLIGSRNEP